MDDYQINYWKGQETYHYKPAKPKRSIKRKLAIVFSFIFVLAITPSLIYSLSSLDLSKANEISLVNSKGQISPAPEIISPQNLEVTIEEPKEAANQTEVISNDNYWKISKRVCGDGKYYLSIQSQNGGKALYTGDTVTASCVL